MQNMAIKRKIRSFVLPPVVKTTPDFQLLTSNS